MFPCEEKQLFDLNMICQEHSLFYTVMYLPTCKHDSVLYGTLFRV